MIERFFRDIATERPCRGVFTSVPELIEAIDQYIAHRNTNPKPFIWTKSARDILQEVIRANSRLCSKRNATLHRRGAAVDILRPAESRAEAIVFSAQIDTVAPVAPEMSRGISDLSLHRPYRCCAFFQWRCFE
jgi:hypothetical protein